MPEGLHTMSVFAQYVPYRLEAGELGDASRRRRDLIVRSLARFCENVPDCIVDMEVMGPPDIEKKVGLTGGHIFQGECLPAYMWSRRLQHRTPMEGRLLVRRLYTSRRKRDRRQWAECGHVGADLRESLRRRRRVQISSVIAWNSSQPGLRAAYPGELFSSCPLPSEV